MAFFNDFSIRNYSEFPYICTPKNWRSMFAIVKIAGQQFKVQPGQSLYVPHLEGKQGDAVEFSEVLLHDNDGKISIGSDANVTVKAEIINELVKGEKVIAFKMKRRKGFRKKHGHRTQYTHIKVTGIA
ncbi:MAG TPA: 50S ribosomal protein L21 [Hanamia sp.]